MDIRPNMEHCIDHFRRFSWGFAYGGFLKRDPLNHGKWHPKTCVLYLVSRTLRHFASPCARKISSLGKKSWLEDTRNRYGKGRHQFFDGTKPSFTNRRYRRKHHSGCWVFNGQKVKLIFAKYKIARPIALLPSLWHHPAKWRFALPRTPAMHQVVHTPIVNDFGSPIWRNTYINYVYWRICPNWRTYLNWCTTPYRIGLGGILHVLHIQ